MTAEQNGTAPEGTPPQGTESNSGERESAPESSATAAREGGSSQGEPPRAEAASSETSAEAASSTGEGGDDGAEDGGDEGGGDEGEASAGEGGAGEGAEGASGEGAPGEGAKKKRRRRRRKKGGESSSGQVASPEGAEGAPAEGGERPAREPRKELHLPFQRFFDGQARGERRHAFSVGEIVAGRVAKLEHGCAVIDLFGKATAFALENEPRDVPIPTPGQVEAEEAEAEAEQPAHAHHGVDLSQVGGAAAGLEGSVGMPGSESLPPPPAEEGQDRAVVMGPGPDGILGTEDDEPLSSESDPHKIARAAYELSAVGTPTADGEPVPAEETEAAGTESSAGSVAAEESAPAEPEEQHPLLEVGTIFRGRVAAVAESGHVAIHNRLVTRADARLKLAKAREEHRRVFGLVYGYNRGGFDVLVEGVRAFCPVGGMTIEHVEEPDTLLGKRLEFSVQQAKSGHQGIVVSRRSILEREARKRAKELRKSLQPGQKVKGRVTQVREFGLFVDLGGLEGLVHLSELSWERGVKPGDVAKPGDEIEVQILRVTEPQGRKDRDGRIGLSLKALQQDPWETQTAELHEGNALKGKITRTTDFGAFVEVAPGVDGLLHITELGRDLKHANEKVKEGDEIHVVIERIDRRQRRISLSKMSAQDAKAFDEGALETGAGGKVVRPGALLKVKVERVEPHGLYVQVEGVLGRRGRGFIPNSEMGTERGTDHRKKFPPGTEIDAKVIGLDRDGGLRMSRKAFAQDEERRAVQDYRKEAATKGFGTFGDILKKKLKKLQ